jgi:hypothetical protein
MGPDVLCATSNDCEAPQPRCSEAPSGVRQGAAGAYSSATMMNRQRFALCSAPIYFPSTCKRTPSADCTWPKGPLIHTASATHMFIVGPHCNTSAATSKLTIYIFIYVPHIDQETIYDYSDAMICGTIVITTS